MTIHYHVKSHMDSLAITGITPGMASISIGVFSVKMRSNSVDFNSADRKSTHPNDTIMDGVHPALHSIIISPLDTGFRLHRLDITPLPFSGDVVLVECCTS